MKLPVHGACYCTAIRFRLTAAPIFTHACHCLNCQKRSGSAFAMSSFVLAANLEILEGEPEFYPEEVNMKILPVSRCPECETHLWYTPDPRLLSTLRYSSHDRVASRSRSTLLNALW